MIRKLLPVFLAVLGLGAGAGAGLFLRPAPDPMAEGEHADEGHTEEGHAEEGHEGDAALPEYVRLANQFVVPIVEDGRVVSMLVMSLSIEVTAGSTEATYSREPKLRDAFLQVLFDHANAGGFRGSFTDGSNLILLREALKEEAVLILGDVVTDVLITDIARQDS